MTVLEIRQLQALVLKLETLQTRTRDQRAQDRIGVAKAELIRLLNEVVR